MNPLYEYLQPSYPQLGLHQQQSNFNNFVYQVSESGGISLANTSQNNSQNDLDEFNRKLLLLEEIC